MEDNSNNKSTTYKVVDFSTKEERKEKICFSKSVLIPFCSGVLGTALVISTCFGVPTIREKIVGNSSNASVTTSTSRNRRRFIFWNIKTSVFNRLF